MEASSELILALSGVIVGIVLGVFGARLMSRNFRENTLLQQKLLESERQVEEFKTRMGTHLLDSHTQIDALRHTASQLEQLIANEAHYWQLDNEKIQQLTDIDNQQPQPSDAHLHNSSETAPDTGVPRDYADGKSGTLSEDFGLKIQDQTPQPPRY